MATPDKGSSIMLRHAIAACLCILVTASVVHAGGPRDHEPGFFLRLSTGVGGGGTERDANPDIKLSGFISETNLAIGGTVTRNLALHATLFGWTAGDPTVESGGTGVELNNAELTMGALGAGITYYFMPLNLYLSPSIGFGGLTLELPGGGDGESDTGVAFDFTIGKEWWVSNRWGLGVAGGLGLHTIPDNDSSEDWKGTSFAIRFSSTFN